MKPASSAVLAIALLPLALGACSAPRSGVRAKLDCPVSQGELTRTGVGADGRSCNYATSRGDLVNLRLAQVTSTPEAALAPIEAELAPPRAPPSPDQPLAEKHADVVLPGLQVHSENHKAEVRLGALHVDASEAGAVIHTARRVRLQGEPFALERRGYRATYLVAGRDLPGGYVGVGYEAGGPVNGPLTVAVVHSREHKSSHLQHDVARLVRLNAGV